MASEVNSLRGQKHGHGSVWDSHVHCYPKEVIADPVGWARKCGEPHWEHLVTSGPQGWADPEELLSAMDRDGIEKVLLQGWYWENPETARRQNDWHAEWTARHPDRLMGCLVVHPEMEDVEAVFKEAEEWGAVAVGECLPQVQNEAGWQHPAWTRILDRTSLLSWPLTLHVTEPVGHEYPGRVETCLMETIQVIEDHPRQKWILAHWGGGLPFYSMNKRIRKALNRVWFDTAASPLLYDERVWKSLCGLIGPEKILFGSDFPLLVYPSAQGVPGWQLLLEELHNCGLSQSDIASIASRNLSSLLEHQGCD